MITLRRSGLIKVAAGHDYARRSGPRDDSLELVSVRLQPEISEGRADQLATSVLCVLL